MSTTRRLYRSRNDNQIAGVCGGLGEYLNIDPTIVRLIFLAMFLFGGPGFFIYIVMWLVIPEEPEDEIIMKRKRKNDEFYEDVV